MLSQTLKLPVANFFMGWTIRLYVINTSNWKPNFILKYSCFSLKIFENKVVNKGKTDLTNTTHGLYTVLFFKNDNFKYTTASQR